MSAHKWCNEIIAWAKGKRIQFARDVKGCEPYWEDYYTPGDCPSWNHKGFIFRIKPTTISFGVALMRSRVDPAVTYINTCHRLSDVELIISHKHFIKWMIPFHEEEI